MSSTKDAHTVTTETTISAFAAIVQGEVVYTGLALDHPHKQVSKGYSLWRITNSRLQFLIHRIF